MVRRHDAVRDREGVDAALEAAARLEVHDLAGDVGAGDVEVVRALAGGEPALVELAGLGIDEVRGEGAGVAAEQGVRQRDVAPEEAHIVQPDEQHGERIDEAIGRVGSQHLREECAIGERELQVRGHERGGKRLARGILPSGDDRHTFDAGGVEAVQVAEHVVLAAGHLLGRLFDGDDAAREVGEPHEVAREALREEDDELLGHSPSGVDHGRVSRPGSTELAVMLNASGTSLPGNSATARGELVPPAPLRRMLTRRPRRPACR